MVRNCSVTVLVLTYNHESLLGQTLDSIIAQKVSNANLSIIVIDDASTDGTRHVVEKYRNSYPELIKPKYYKSNQYQSGGAPEFPVMEEVDSDFIAFCDGDDYWLDQYKIEKQLEEFQRNESLAIVHTDYFLGKIEQDDFKLIRRSEKDRKKAKDLTGSFDLVYGNEIKKSTAMYRKNFIDFDFLRKCNGVRAQDWLVSVSASANGGIFFFDEPTTVYRLSNNASFQSLTQEERLQVKTEVRQFCSIHHPNKKLRNHFRRFMFKESFKKIIRDSYIYSLFRPLVIMYRQVYWHNKSGSGVN